MGARYALARGNKAEAMELWPLIEWCLEFCNRKLTLLVWLLPILMSWNTAFRRVMPIYVPLIALLRCVKFCGFTWKRIRYSIIKTQNVQTTGKALEKAIEDHFGCEIEGFHSYRYYEGNDNFDPDMYALTVGIYTRAKGTVEALFFTPLMDGKRIVNASWYGNILG